MKQEIKEEKAKREAERDGEEKAWKEERFQGMLGPHSKYMETYMPPPPALQIDHIVGEDIVKCVELDDVSYFSSSLSGGTIKLRPMSLHIHPPSARSSHGVMAAFDFDTLEGTMLLGMSDDAVQRLREDVDDIKDTDWYGDYGSDSDSDSDSDNPYSRKRKVKNHPSHQPTKRRLGETPRPNRVYPQWAGRQSDGEIEVDERNENTGYLDFSGNRASAQGEFKSPSWIGSKMVSFSIYKVSDRPSEKPTE